MCVGRGKAQRKKAAVKEPGLDLLEGHTGGFVAFKHLPF